jgi:hypothetical protein
MAFFGTNVELGFRIKRSQDGAFNGLDDAGRQRVQDGWAQAVSAAIAAHGDLADLQNLAAPEALTDIHQIYSWMDGNVEHLLQNLSPGNGTSPVLMSNVGGGWLPCGRNCHITMKQMASTDAADDEAVSAVSVRHEEPGGSGTFFVGYIKLTYKVVEFD